MSRDLKKEFRTLRENLMTCFKETKITDKSFTSLILSMVWLYVLLDQERKTKISKERRRMTREFRKRKKDLKKRIQDIYEQTKRPNIESKELSR